MRKIGKLIIITAGVLFFNSCAVDHPVDEPTFRTTRGEISIEVLDPANATEDHIYKARFIVFDNASSFPKLDINKVKTLDTEDQDAKKIKATLTVNCNPDKAVFVVLNEPDAISAELNAVTSFPELENIIFRMADAFTTNDTSPAVTGIPMTGTARKIAVDTNNTTENPAKATIEIQRSVARVEIYMMTDGISSGWIDNNTTITLSNSYDKGYLMSFDPANNFGKMTANITPNRTAVYAYTNTVQKDLAVNRQLICTFYTPERTCTKDNDKLILKIEGVNSTDGMREGEITLSELIPQGSAIPQPVDTVKRNNAYRITAIVKEKAIKFENTIAGWEDVGVGVIIDPQYYLHLSRDRINLFGDEGENTITAKTNYNLDTNERGYPKGIVLGEKRYFDTKGNEVTGSGGSNDNWLDVNLTGNADDPTRAIELSATLPLIETDEGCYAEVEIKAGNIIKTVQVIRWIN